MKIIEETVAGLISVIVPVYNVEKYIEKCIDSISKQTYRNLEIILIDDGSTDNSGQICDEYLKMDSRIQVYHKKNGGLSSARNAGLRVARGEWVGFVDSDDYIEPDMYETLLGSMGEDVDIVCCARKIMYPSEAKKQFKYFCTLNKEMVFSNEEAMRELLLQKNMSFSVCTKLFRRSLLKDMYFPYGKTSEDLPFTYEAFKRSRNVVHVGKPKYINYHRQDSISRKPFYLKRMNYVQFSATILSDVTVNYAELRQEAEAMYIKNIYSTIMNIEHSPDNGRYTRELNKLKKEFLSMYIRNFHNSYVPKFIQQYFPKCFMRYFGKDIYAKKNSMEE